MCVGKTEPLPDELGLLEDIGDDGMSVHNAKIRLNTTLPNVLPNGVIAYRAVFTIATILMSPLLDEWPQRDPMLSKKGMQSAHRVGLNWHVAVLQVDECRANVDICRV